MYWPYFDKTDSDGLISVLNQDKHGRNGPEAKRFEHRFAEYNDVRNCILCANGTTAIELILRGLNIGRGDEVIVPPYTFIATIAAVIFAGATPVFADVEPDTCNLSAESVRNKITPRTKAVIPVHVGGRPADMDAFDGLAKETGLYIIGDAAQAAGSRWRDKGIGSYGTAASFSCQGSKNLNCGEGGIITTNDDGLARDIRAILGGGIGQSGEYTHIGAGHNITEWQASVLNTQMDKLDGQISLRMENAAYLDGLLDPLPYVSPLKSDGRITKNTYHLYIIRIHEEYLRGVSRDRFIEAAKSFGCGLTGAYMPLYDFPCLEKRYADIPPETAVTEQLSRHETAWLYHSILLDSKTEIESAAGAVIKVYENLDEIKAGRHDIYAK
jgi:dTDP-4-amino-4,6-dideoxygalactose transaminase